MAIIYDRFKKFLSFGGDWKHLIGRLTTLTTIYDIEENVQSFESQVIICPCKHLHWWHWFSFYISVTSKNQTHTYWIQLQRETQLERKEFSFYSTALQQVPPTSDIDFVWLCLTLFNFVDLVWLCSTLFDFVRCQTKSTPVEQSLYHFFNFVQPCLTLFDLVQLCSTLFDWLNRVDITCGGELTRMRSSLISILISNSSVKI